MSPSAVLMVFWISIAVQAFAVYLALRVMVSSRIRWAWGAIAVALALILPRRVITTFAVMRLADPTPFLGSELMSLTLSLLFCLGLVRLRTYFERSESDAEFRRLSEEHFKDEWVAFKADDQKRWTNYSLMVEEMSRERNREITKFQERLAKVEDAIQSLIDSIELINEETEKRLKNFLSLSNEIMSSFEQSLGKRK